MIKYIISENMLPEKLYFRGSSERTSLGPISRYSSEKALCCATIVPREEWEHKSPNGNSSGAYIRTIVVNRSTNYMEIEIVTRNNPEGHMIETIVNPTIELIISNDNTLLGAVIKE